jgi:hypothetical protein
MQRLGMLHGSHVHARCMQRHHSPSVWFRHALDIGTCTVSCATLFVTTSLPVHVLMYNRLLATARASHLYRWPCHVRTMYTPGRQAAQHSAALNGTQHSNISGYVLLSTRRTASLPTASTYHHCCQPARFTMSEKLHCAGNCICHAALSPYVTQPRQFDPH